MTMTDTAAPGGYERIEWPEVREDDVLMHANGDRLTVSAVDHVGYPTCKSTAGSWHSVSTLRGAGFSPYRKQPELPNEPGAYLDKHGVVCVLAPRREGDVLPWIAKVGGFHQWASNEDMAAHAPFTRLVTMPTEEQVRRAVGSARTGTGFLTDDATAAVIALLGGDSE